ncbi:MAG: hypothetical protein ABGZ17_28665 [Planctomycetaceae bacterium]
MTRSIAILTLILTAVLSVDEAFAQGFRPVPNPVVWFNVDSEGGSSDLYLPDDLDTLIAIIALTQTAESGLDDITGMLHAYDTLRDMGFRAEDANDVVTVLIPAILSFEFQELTILQFNPREYTFTK